MKHIGRAAVLGAGVMGSQIAALLADAGVPTLLLDMPSLAATAKDRLATMVPRPFARRSSLALIETGSFDDDMARISDCDWIVEAITEDPAVKRDLFARVARHRAPDAILSTNTSGLPLRLLIEAMDPAMRRHFIGTHFFNPPRYLKLIEVIAGPDTSPDALATLSHFLTNTLGRGLVRAKDTPNFIANRVGAFWTQFAMHEFIHHDLTIEDVDLLTGTAIGHARSGTFQTIDLIGLDTYARVLANVHGGCPEDERRDVMRPPDWFRSLLDRGYLGAKSGSGFYRRTSERDHAGRAVVQTLDLQTMAYRPPMSASFECLDAAANETRLEDKLRRMYASADRGSQFAWRCFAHTAAYAANRLGEITDDLAAIDNALKWGFGWELGIFETWDLLGVEYVRERMAADGIQIPPLAHALHASGLTSFYAPEADGERPCFEPRTRGYIIPQ